LRYYRTTGLILSQMQELVCRVQAALTESWKKGIGRPKSCGLYEAVEIACMYLRQNVTEEFLGDMRHVSQPTVSRIVTVLVPIVKSVLEEFVPSAEEAIEMASGRVCLVDGTITPCWSYEDHQELWSRKHGTTGFNAQLVCVLSGNPIYISDPLPGKTHDVTAFKETPVVEIVKNSGGGIAAITASPRTRSRRPLAYPITGLRILTPGQRDGYSEKEAERRRAHGIG
jgi:DDE superfamily endonuclease